MNTTQQGQKQQSAVSRLLSIRHAMEAGAQKRLRKELVSESKALSPEEETKRIKYEQAKKRKEQKEAIKNEKSTDVLLSMTAEEAEKMNKPPKEIVFWDVTSDESQYRQFERRRKTMSSKTSVEHERQIYENQKKKLGELIYANDDALVQGVAHKPKAEDLDKLIDEMEKERRKPFSRPRPTKDEDDEEITFINERNRKYNLKLNRAFDKYTTETKENLERGTAL